MTRTPGSTDPTPHSSREKRLSEWNEEKGYGWIGGKGTRVFVHIRDFEPGQRRPGKGDEVVFQMGMDEKGRPRAVKVRLVKAEARIGWAVWVILSVLLVLPWLAGLCLPGPDWALMAGMGMMSLVTWFAYRRDKRSAKAGEWRTSEMTLHLLELLGGWPGAFLAQRRFRHKVRKPSYQIVFIGIVIFHQLAAADVILDHAPGRWVVERLVSLVQSR